MSARRYHWYASLLHPVTVGCFALLLVNDHWLKPYHPGWLSGKLSDVAFMVVAPLWLFAAWSRLTCGSVALCTHYARQRALQASLLLIAITLLLMETTFAGDWLYRYGLGALQFPFRAAASWCLHAEWPELRSVVATRDLTDLLCLPFLAVARWIGEQSILFGHTPSHAPSVSPGEAPDHA